MLSFSTIFILLGLGATAVGATLNDHRETLQKASAVLIVAMGVFFVAAPFVTRLNREFHVSGLMQRAGRGGPIVAGAAFAIAWTPCIGPTLGAILSAAALSGSASHGAVLLAFYSAGLAIPFLLTSLAFGSMTNAFSVVKRHYSAVIATGGVVLIAMGVLIWTGEFFRLNVEAQNLLNNLGLGRLEQRLRVVPTGGRMMAWRSRSALSHSTRRFSPRPSGCRLSAAGTCPRW